MYLCGRGSTSSRYHGGTSRTREFVCVWSCWRESAHLARSAEFPRLSEAFREGRLTRHVRRASTQIRLESGRRDRCMYLCIIARDPCRRTFSRPVFPGRCTVGRRKFNTQAEKDGVVLTEGAQRQWYVDQPHDALNRGRRCLQLSRVKFGKAYGTEFLSVTSFRLEDDRRDHDGRPQWLRRYH